MKCVRNGGTVTALAFISVLPASLDLCAKNWLLAGPYVFEKALRGERAIKEMIESMNGQGVPHKGQFALQVELNEGWNEILVKIAGGSTGSGFWMAVSEFDGVEISAH